ncbi:glutamate decarboxylase/sphingosine phosphate lyase [Heterobasidion irregulare TC 32-1]|uniref:Glutamate decarboxylase n=1 Tax=Heterobasidion irregulare (strain TC 32-1) TaxID=747525 RepID=W4JZD2_HETIT|nr:glutamate decarboxylase/sphingosine phosphate lyase [Heterobasidion irregulare TC 32-1]ETW78814.1 glutamate decarboxylase/sphingosine phosphate lyase [Heterobasidion irregulare TC 32-1]
MGFLSTVPSDERSNAHEVGHDQYISTTVYGSALAACEFPRFEMREEEMPARTAARFVHDELLMDGSPALNLASFVTTYMEDEAERLMLENLSKNFIDVEEYPALGEIESRCVNMIARLFNAPLDTPEAEALGVSTIGSSEAIILSVLAAKRRWQNARKAAGKPYDKPNLVMNSAVQVCWEKAARYLEVEERYLYCTSERFVIDPKEAVDLVDENTILVCAILGSTYTGEYEDVQGLNDLLQAKNEKEGLDVHIHVDAASGGFVAPFVNPQLLWDFRVPLVCSINVSGHKCDLAYAGVGWALWRSKAFLPEEILFTVNYLGSPQVSFTLNFSKSAVQVIGQYYQLLRLGKSGYRAIMTNLTETADYLAESVVKFAGGDKFVLMSKTGGEGLPLVAWRLKNQEHYDEFSIARQLRARGWIVPAYTMAPHSDKLKLLRVVVREDFSRSRCETFIRDLTAAVKFLDNAPKEVVEHLAQTKLPQSHTAANKSHKHHHHEKHSLAGQHDKTHGVC